MIDQIYPPLPYCWPILILSAGLSKACGFIMMAASPRPLDVLMREQYDFLYSLMPEITEEQQAEKDAVFAELDKLRDLDAHGNTFDALMCLPLSEDFSKVKGKLIESSDFEKLEDEKRLEEINREFPVYRKVKVQEGFMQIFEQHLGVVEARNGDKYMVRYWELLIPAKLSEGLEELPSVGSDVKFIWNHKGESKITQVFRNLLED